jgi:hypothetical protein
LALADEAGLPLDLLDLEQPATETRARPTVRAQTIRVRTRGGRISLHCLSIGVF